MKFKIRYADQIVGFFIVLSLVALVFVIIMLGKSQRWFAKDASFHTILPSAGGLSKNMAVQYKGFSIGTIKDFYLNDQDNVEVLFIVHEEYKDRVKQGSLVEVMQSPVGLGSQFLFHAGNGDVLEDGSLVPVVGSAQARELIRQGLAAEPYHDDSISVLMSRASTTLDGLNRTLSQVNEALGPGSDVTEIGKIVGSIRKTLAGSEALPGTVDRTVSEALKTVEDLQAQLKPILANISDLTAKLNDPNGTVYSILDTDKDVYVNLVNSLKSVSAILDSLDKTAAFLPGQAPQLAAIIANLRVTLKTADDVLTALTNNPLLRGGIPAKPESQGGGTGPRDIRF